VDTIAVPSVIPTALGSFCLLSGHPWFTLSPQVQALSQITLLAPELLYHSDNPGLETTT